MGCRSWFSSVYDANDLARSYCTRAHCTVDADVSTGLSQRYPSSRWTFCHGANQPSVFATAFFCVR